jgi:para-nitrobenzyl esterase
MRKTVLCALAMAEVLIAARLFALGDPLNIKTEQGTVHGKAMNDGKVRAFLGVPYAAPPVGELRWKPPQPPTKWKGVRDATNFGARCPQWAIWADYIFLDSGPSEDCLHLNIYAPATATDASRLPVMFWIHGGGYAAGAGSEPRYTNSLLPLHGVVLITIDYRMGVFGFLASEDLAREGVGSAGNYGLQDMVAALRWVRKNIVEFGGDANNVTIFGESAGSFAVSTLMAVPEARGLFARAIGESGADFNGVIGTSSLAERAKRDQAWVESLGVKSLTELRAVPMDRLLDEARKKGVVGFSPVVDGRFLPESAAEIYAAGKQAQVPLLAGWNRDERTDTLSKGMTAAKWKVFATEHYGAHAEGFLKAFPASSDEEAIRSADNYTTDQFIAFGTWQWVEAQAKTGGGPVYRYHFELPAPASEMHPEGRYAFHSDDLEYVFGTLDARHGSVWRPEDRKLSEEMIGYWTNFAKTGDPNGPGLPEWRRYDETGEVMHLDADSKASPDTTKTRYEFLLENKPTN